MINNEALVELLSEIVVTNERFVRHECSPDTFECKYCSSEVDANSTSEIEHDADCLMLKAKVMLKEIENEI